MLELRPVEYPVGRVDGPVVDPKEQWGETILLQCWFRGSRWELWVPELSDQFGALSMDSLQLRADSTGSDLPIGSRSKAIWRTRRQMEHPFQSRTLRSGYFESSQSAQSRQGRCRLYWRQMPFSSCLSVQVDVTFDLRPDELSGEDCLSEIGDPVNGGRVNGGRVSGANFRCQVGIGPLNEELAPHRGALRLVDDVRELRVGLEELVPE
jgi:hypothetical protein